MYKGSTYRNTHKKVNNHMHKQMGKHVFKRVNKAIYHAHHMHHVLSHMGELILVSTIGFMSLMLAGTPNMPNNTSFGYPLKKVSTLECRTLYRNDMPDSCKINLPIIHNADYKVYKDNAKYRSIYTTLRAAPYSDTWNQKIGAHPGVDMATARGTPLYSIGDGEVYSAGPNSAYGNVVKIKYIYNGEIVYAVYAHMDTIDVKVGDKVTKGQRIGAVGNSGNTFGALGGYHVHFEIDKDNYGRPAYSFANCPDLKKGHYKIIQNGLCRIQLFTHQYDPIKILESNSTYMPETEDKEKEIIVDEKEIVSSDTGLDNLDITDLDITKVINEKNEEESGNNKLEQNDDLDKWKKIIKDTQDDTKENDKKESSSIHKAPVDKAENVEDIDDNPNVDEKVLIDTGTHLDINLNLDEDKTLLKLDFEGVSLLAKHFISLWEIEMHSDLLKKNLSIGETITLDISAFKKGIYTDLTDDEIKEVKEKNKKYNRYKGILKEPFTFVASNDNIAIDTNYLQLITKGKAQVQITGEKRGKSSMVIEFGGKKIGMLDITIK